MRLRACVGLLLSLVSCAADVVRPPAESRPEAPLPAFELHPGDLQPRQPAGDGGLVALPSKLERPETVACSYRTESFRGASFTTKLALRRGGRSFVTIDGARAEVTLPRGKAVDATIDAQSDGVSLRGLAPAATIELHPTKGVVLSDIAITQPTARLSWTGGGEGTVDVSMARPEELRQTEAELRATRPCSDVALDASTFVPSASVFADKKGRYARLTPGWTPVRTTPEGEVAGSFIVPDGARVFVYETMGKQSHVAWTLSSVVLFGWVDSKHVEPTNGGIGRSSTRGSVRTGPVRTKPVAKRFCPAALPIVAEVGKERALVGSAAAGVLIEVLSWDEPFSPIWIQTTGFRMSYDGGRLLARTDELVACRRAAMDG